MSDRDDADADASDRRLLDGLIHRADLDGLVRLVDDCCAHAGLGRPAPAARPGPPRRRHRPPAVAGGDAGRVPAGPAGAAASGRRPCSTRDVRAVHDRPADRGRRRAPHVGRAGAAARAAGRAPRSSPTSGCSAASRSTRRRWPSSPTCSSSRSSSRPWEPTYALADYNDAGPSSRARRAHARRRPSTCRSTSGTRLDDADRRARRAPARRAVDVELQRPGRRGRRRGRRRPARSARSAWPARRGRRARRRPRRWPGWRGPVPAAAPTAAGAAPPPAGSARCGCSPRSATRSTTGRSPPAELGELAGELRWYWWDAHEPATGWQLQLAVEDPPTASPGRSTPATSCA